MPPARALRTAELLSIGTELTVGETRDTNAGDLARVLTGRGVVVGRIMAIPDDLAAVTRAFGDALDRADLGADAGRIAGRRIAGGRIAGGLRRLRGCTGCRVRGVVSHASSEVV